MAIPDFQTIMLPLLQHMADGKKHSNRELTETLADYFQLSEDERSKLLPSGKQKLFNNRVAWSKTDLKMAGLIDSPRRGISVITQLGTDVLQHPPERIDRNFLKQFPEYFKKITQGGKKEDSENNNQIVLIDGEELAGLIIDYGVGVSITNLYEIKRIDFDYFEEA